MPRRVFAPVGVCQPAANWIHPSFASWAALAFFSFFFLFPSCYRSRAVSLLNPQFRVRGLTARTRAHPLAPCTAENVSAAARNNPRRGWHAIQFSSAQISDPLVSLQVDVERVSTRRQPARDPPQCYFKERALNDVHKIPSVVEAASRWTSWPKFRCIWLLFSQGSAAHTFTI